MPSGCRLSGRRDRNRCPALFSCVTFLAWAVLEFSLLGPLTPRALSQGNSQFLTLIFTGRGFQGPPVKIPEGITHLAVHNRTFITDLTLQLDYLAPGATGEPTVVRKVVLSRTFNVWRETVELHPGYYTLWVVENPAWRMPITVGDVPPPPPPPGGAAISDYEYRIDRRNPWISTGSTNTTHTVSDLVNGATYVFEVRAVNRIGKSWASNRVEAPEAPEAPEAFTLDFAHFANGKGITSEVVLLNVGTTPIRPALYFSDRQGDPVTAETVLDVTGDLEVQDDGGLTVRTAMEPLGELTIATHGRGEEVSGSVQVVSEGAIGGALRYSVPGVGVTGVGAGPPVRDALFPARRQQGGIRTAAAIHNLGEEAMKVRCRLMSGGAVLEEAEIPLEPNGQTSWFIEKVFTATDTADFVGTVRCTAPLTFSGLAVEVDAGNRIFTTLPVAPVEESMSQE